MSPKAFRAPGIARRTRLLQAARQLLKNRDLASLSLADVAAKARIPKGSAYHYYGDILDLYAQLLALIDDELLEDARRPMRNASIESWADVVEILIRRAVRYYAADPAARQLILSAKAPPELKLRDRQNDIQIGDVFARHIEARFVLPAHPRRTRVLHVSCAAASSRGLRSGKRSPDPRGWPSANRRTRPVPARERRHHPEMPRRLSHLRPFERSQR